jgi:hypothetical protein
MSQGCLRDFFAIAIYQAGLTLWSYGVISNAAATAIHPDGTLGSGLSPATQKHFDNITVLDRSDTGDNQRFIAMNRGSGAISGDLGEQAGASYVLLSDPGAVMGVLVGVLKANHKSQHSLPPLVSNLTSLMDGLRMAVGGSSQPQ